MARSPRREKSKGSPRRSTSRKSPRRDKSRGSPRRSRRVDEDEIEGVIAESYRNRDKKRRSYDKISREGIRRIATHVGISAMEKDADSHAMKSLKHFYEEVVPLAVHYAVRHKGKERGENVRVMLSNVTSALRATHMKMYLHDGKRAMPAGSSWRASVTHLIREIASDSSAGKGRSVEWESAGLEALKMAGESYVHSLMAATHQVTKHAGRAIVTGADIHLTHSIRHGARHHSHHR